VRLGEVEKYCHIAAGSFTALLITDELYASSQLLGREARSGCDEKVLTRRAVMAADPMEFCAWRLSNYIPHRFAVTATPPNGFWMPKAQHFWKSIFQRAQSAVLKCKRGPMAGIQFRKSL
jgi:hypothetical protein